MDDLIRREDVLRIIRNGWNNHCSCKDMCDEINRILIVYNVDKVVEQIIQKSYEIKLEGALNASDKTIIELKDVLDIVKSGGTKIEYPYINGECDKCANHYLLDGDEARCRVTKLGISDAMCVQVSECRTFKSKAGGVNG